MRKPDKRPPAPAPQRQPGLFSSADTITVRELAHRWVAIVGHRLAAVSRPERMFDHGVLVIVVANEFALEAMHEHDAAVLRALPDIDGARVARIDWRYQAPERPVYRDRSISWALKPRKPKQ